MVPTREHNSSNPALETKSHQSLLLHIDFHDGSFKLYLVNCYCYNTNKEELFWPTDLNKAKSQVS